MTYMSFMGSSGEISECNKYCDYPIEQLWKAIYMFQFMSELDKDTESLRKKLHKYLMKATEEEKGVRQYGLLRYYPNGYCSMNHSYHIILPGYESSYVPPEPEPVVQTETVKKPRRASTRKYPVEKILIQQDYYLSFPIWYAQIKEHMKRKGYSVKKFDFIENMKKRDIYNSLNDDEKKMIDESHSMRRGFTDAAKSIYDTFMKHFPNSYFNMMVNYKENPKQYHFTASNRDFKHSGVPKTVFPFLMEDEIEELMAICERAYNKYQERPVYHRNASIRYYLEGLLPDFMKKLDLKREGRVTIDFSKAVTKETIWGKQGHYVRKTHPTQNYQYNSYEQFWAQQEAWTPNAVFDVLIEQTAKIKDPTIIKILDMMGLWHPDLFPEETEEVVAETTEEPVIETVQAEPEFEIIEVGEKPKRKRAEVITIEGEVIEC